MNINYLLCMVPAFLVVAIAGWAVKSAYNTWSKVPTSSGLNGLQAAQRKKAAMPKPKPPNLSGRFRHGIPQSYHSQR